MAEEVKHYQVNGKFKVIIERAAVKGVDGFKVEANNDELLFAVQDAKALYESVKNITQEKEQ